MSRVEKTGEARGNLLEIWIYVSRDSVSAADRVVDTIDEKCDLLAEFSEMGRRRDDLELGIRVFPVGKYAICYRPITDGIEIVRVLHFSRDIEALFDSP